MKNSQVTILGARGSIPVSGNEYGTYGGATSCVLLEAENEDENGNAASQVIVFDAGSGFLNLPRRVWKEHGFSIHILV